jgi:hypothetical protein
MFCADSHQDVDNEEEGSTISHKNSYTIHDYSSTMENDLIRNMTLTAINHPSRSGSILMSLVDDLSFWDIDETRQNNNKSISNSNSSCDRHKNNDCSRNSIAQKKSRSTIPSMVEAIKLDEKRGGVYRRDISKDSFESDDVDDVSPPVCTTSWKTAVDPSTGKMYYYDSITRKTQWDKVRFTHS